MNYVSDWIDTLCMEWQKQLNDFMIIDGLEDANSSIIAKGALLMDKQKNGELSRMFSYAGNYHALTILGCVLSGISTILSMLPFVCIWLVIRDLIQAFAAGDIRYRMQISFWSLRMDRLQKGEHTKNY